MFPQASSSVPRNSVLGVLLVLLSCAVAVPQSMAVTVTYDIQAYIDLHDLLIIRADTVQWHHVAGAAVGRWEGHNEPTIISTDIEGTPQLLDFPWIPDWPEPPPAEIRYQALSSVLTNLKPALPATATVTMTLVQARDRATLRQLPTAANNHTLMVEFIDEPNRASWYHIILTVEWQSWFPDVPPEHWAVGAINACVNADIVSGYPDGYYRPERTVARDQMAVYLTRAFDLPM